MMGEGACGATSDGPGGDGGGRKGAAQIERGPASGKGGGGGGGNNATNLRRNVTFRHKFATDIESSSQICDGTSPSIANRDGH